MVQLVNKKDETMNEKEMEKEFEWVSVSELAQRLGVSDQTIYNHIKEGLYETMEFQRGTMKGILVKTLKQ